MTSTDIGVTETKTTAVGLSLQLVGTGSAYTDFTWISGAPQSFGAINDRMFLTGECVVGDDGSCVADSPSPAETGAPAPTGEDESVSQVPKSSLNMRTLRCSSTALYLAKGGLHDDGPWHQVTAYVCGAELCGGHISDFACPAKAD